MSPRACSSVAAALLVVGALVLAAGVLVGYASHAVLDRDAFAKNVTTAVKKPAVRTEIAGRLADALISADPDLVSFRPVAVTVGSSLLSSGTFDPIVHRAAREFHKEMFERENSDVALDLADGAELLSSVLAVRLPRETRALRSELKLVVAEVENRSFATGTLQAAEALSILRWVLIPLGALLLAASVLVAPARRRAVTRVGIVVGASGLLLLVGELAARAILPDRFAEPAAIGQVLGVFFHDALRWAIVLMIVGAVLCASARAREDAHEGEHLLTRVGRYVIGSPSTNRGHVLRGLVLVGIGLGLVLAPTAAVAVGAFVLGFVFIVDGVAELVGVLAGGPAQAAAPAKRARRHTALFVAIGGVVVAVAFAGGALALASSGKPVEEFGDACNGAVELCDRPLDRVTFAASHNAMSSLREGYLDANNLFTIVQDLDSGIRGLLIDTHLARPTNRRTIADTVFDETTRRQAAAELGPEALNALEAIVRRDVAKPTGPPGPYLCHIVCEAGATPLVDALRDIGQWLERHPREVVVIDVQDALTPKQTGDAFRKSGLLARTFTYRRGDPLPTLRRMIDARRTLFVMAEAVGIPDTWYPPGYRYLLKETPYDNKSVNVLRSDASCRPNRGQERNPLFLVNHWVATYPPKPSRAAVVNRREFLLDRVERCARIRKAYPTIVAVDFSNLGDVVSVAQTLNRRGVRAARD